MEPCGWFTEIDVPERILRGLRGERHGVVETITTTQEACNRAAVDIGDDPVNLGLAKWICFGFNRINHRLKRIALEEGEFRSRRERCEGLDRRRLEDFAVKARPHCV